MPQRFLRHADFLCLIDTHGGFLNHLLLTPQALQGLEAPTIAKQETNWPACRDVLVLGAVQYQQSEFVAHALIELVRKHEHMPQLAALTAKYAEEQHNNTQLVSQPQMRWYLPACSLL